MASCVPSRQTACSRRRAFTLVELLVVIAIIALVAALTAGALFMLPGRAQVRTTEALISKLDAALQRRLNDAARRANRAQLAEVDRFLAAANPTRAAVVAKTRTVRQQLPERFLLNPRTRYRWRRPTTITTPSGSSALLVGDFSLLDYSGASGPTQRPRQLPPTASDFVAAIQHAFLLGKLSNHNVQTTRAECLFLIIAGGVNVEAIADEFGPNEIGDTDQDGLPEFLDAWGNPIAFFLWPYQYRSPAQPMAFDATFGQFRPSQSGNTLDPDGTLTELDYISTTQRSLFEATFHPVTFPAGSTTPFAYRLYPLIVSAGPDGKFGLVRDPGPDGQPGTGDDGEMIDSALRLADVRPTPLNHPEFGADSDNIDNHSLRAR